MQWIRTLALVTLLALAGSPALAQNTTRIVAVVDEEVVSLSELEAREALVIATGGLGRDARTRETLRPQVLRSLVDEALQRQEARRLGVAATPQDVDRALADVAQRNNMDVPGLIRMVERSGGTEQTLRRQLAAQIGWLRIINSTLRSRVQVTDAQVDAAFLEAQRTAADDEVRLGRILLPVYRPEQEDAVRRDAAGLVAQIRGGASFEVLARQVSSAAEAENGGDLGWVSVTTLPADLARELAKLEPGEVTPPLRSQNGIQIIQLRERRTAEPIDPTGAPRVRISQILFPVETESAAARAMDRAREVRNGLTSCAAVNQAAQRLGAPASGDLGWLNLAELPPPLARLLAQLPPGQISDPVRGPAGVQLLMVCERAGRFERPPPPTRDAVRQRLEREQIERLAARYLRELRQDAFIDLRL